VTAQTIGSVLAAVIVAILGFWFSRIDRKRKEARNVETHPDSGRALSRFRDWVQHKQSGSDFQP